MYRISAPLWWQCWYSVQRVCTNILSNSIREKDSNQSRQNTEVMPKNGLRHIKIWPETECELVWRFVNTYMTPTLCSTLNGICNSKKSWGQSTFYTLQHADLRAESLSAEVLGHLQAAAPSWRISSCVPETRGVIMHFVAWIQPSLDLSTGISTLPRRMPSEKEGQQRRESESKDEGVESNGEMGRWQERWYRGSGVS